MCSKHSWNEGTSVQHLYAHLGFSRSGTGTQLLTDRVCAFSVFLEIAELLSKVAAIDLPIFLDPRQHKFCQTEGRKSYPAVLVCISLIISKVEFLFMFPLAWLHLCPLSHQVCLSGPQCPYGN